MTTIAATRDTVALALMLTAFTGTAIAQDVQKGERSFNKCVACHAVGPRAENRIGPQLNGLDGRRAGSVPNFSYSDAIRTSGFTWSEEAFGEYIRNPAGKFPGTRMTFAGIKSDQEIRDLWAYVRQFSADGGAK